MESPHANHRARVQKRVSQYGLEGMEEHEALEYLLFFVIPRKDTNPIAHELIHRFGNFCGVLEASEEELCTVNGIGPAAARYIHSLHLLNNYYATHRVQKKVSLLVSANAIEFVRPLFTGLKNERLYMIAVDDRGYHKRTTLVAEGQPGAVDVPMSKLAREAVASSCTAVFFAHNHPGGIPVPSIEDVQFTRQTVKMLGLLGITVTDHIIEADGEALSLAKSGRMPYFDPLRGEVDL